MFKQAAIKRYGKRLHPYLQKRYGKKTFYSASEVRATVYQCSFKPKFLPLGYLLFLDKNALDVIIKKEFPALNINEYKKEMAEYFNGSEFHGSLQLLAV